MPGVSLTGTMCLPSQYRAVPLARPCGGFRISTGSGGASRPDTDRPREYGPVPPARILPYGCYWSLCRSCWPISGRAWGGRRADRPIASRWQASRAWW